MEGDARAAGADPKRMRCEQPGADLLSALPEALLLHILSFLRMEDVVKTALLSRRWRHLWTSTPCLDFCTNKIEWLPHGNYASPSRGDDLRSGHQHADS